MIIFAFFLLTHHHLLLLIYKKFNKMMYWLLFKVVWLMCQVWLVAESLINGFIRYIYIPVFHSNLNTTKIIKDIKSLEKKPLNQITLVVEVKIQRRSEIHAIALKVIRYGRIVEEGTNPLVLNCYLDTTFTTEKQADELKREVEKLLKEDNSKMKVFFARDFNYAEPINSEKSKMTPLVVVFSSYPSILGLHPSFLVGAEISFHSSLLRTTDYDLYQSLHSYATSQQRKGK